MFYMISYYKLNSENLLIVIGGGCNNRAVELL